MIHKVYTVYDSKAEAYLPPFYQQTKGTAIRVFTETANDPQSAVSRYAEDFTLFELGSYDDNQATFNLHKTPISIGKAIEFKNHGVDEDGKPNSYDASIQPSALSGNTAKQLRQKPRL